MKIIFLVVLAIVAAISPTTLLAETQSFEGVAVIAGASINPPNPVQGCLRAKEDARKKAEAAGFKGTPLKWDRLSNDSDCSLRTEGGRTGYFYIFIARGMFSK